MALEDAPGEEVDEGLEEVREEELGVLEDARRLAGDASARLADERRDVPGEDDAALLERLPERLPGRVIELGVDVGDHEIHLAHAALRPHPLELGERPPGRPPPSALPRPTAATAPSGVSGSIGRPMSRSGAALQKSSSQSL